MSVGVLDVRWREQSAKLGEKTHFILTEPFYFPNIIFYVRRLEPNAILAEKMYFRFV